MLTRPRLQMSRRLLSILFLISLTFCLWLGHPSNVVRLEVASAQSSEASQLVQQGVELYQDGNFRGAIAEWQTALKIYQDTKNPTNEAIVLENLARAYGQIGQINQAVSYWEQAIANHRQLENWQQVERGLTEQAQAYSRIGQQRRAIALLCGGESKECVPGSAVQLAQEQNDRFGEAAALGSLGEASRLRGNYERAIESLQTSLVIARNINNVQLRSSALNSLGNAYSSLAQVNDHRATSARQSGEIEQGNQFEQTASRNDAQALKYFQESLKLAREQNNQLGQMRSLLNSIPLDYRREANVEANQKFQQALALLPNLPQTQEKVYAAIDLAMLQPDNSPTHCLKPEHQEAAIALLQQAVSIARSLEDNRALSFALGELGHVYECRQDYAQALELTQRARWAAEQDQLAKDSLYRWEWQTGRILKAQGQENEAIGAYEGAIATLETIRDELLVANRDLQFDFRDTVEPIYRQLIELKLETQPSPLVKSVDANINLPSVLQTADSLKLAELQNYFGDECDLRGIKREDANLADATPNTAVFSSIILPDRTAIILNLPDGQQKIAQIAIDDESLREEINQFRLGLESFFDQYNLQPAQKVYDWLIRPFEADLQPQIKTLVFIQDGILRSVPMAALHDGKQFLIQKYAIATTPSLSLTTPNASNRQRLRALALGLSESAIIDGHDYPPLPYVRQEIDQVQQQLPGSKLLLNKEFTLQRLQQELRKNAYPIIHIATHGVFGTVPEDTFLVTGSEQKLTINELDTLIRTTEATEPLELLTLTACQTAIGDERSALGLAGVAVQAGAKSALASLWSIEDAATAQMANRFYQGLNNPGTNKAQALREAQIALLEGGQYAHPAYWAPYILIGNWL